jgi:hypothetical protein
VALYRQAADGLLPVPPAWTGDGRFEREIGELAWRNLDEVTGEDLFRVRSQATVDGGAVDVVALTRQGELALVLVSRVLDLTRLAGCLALVAWARSASLTEVAGLYHQGPAAFWTDWQEFTSTGRPVRLQRNPVLFLICQDVEPAARSAFAYLAGNGVPVRIVSITVYEAEDGERLVDVQDGAGSSSPGDAPSMGFPNTRIPDTATIPSASTTREAPAPAQQQRGDSRRVGLPDLVAAGLLAVGADLVWSRPRMGLEYRARITPEGRIALPDGREFATPSAAAMAAAGIASSDGWHAWRVGSARGRMLDDVRRELGDA